MSVKNQSHQKKKAKKPLTADQLALAKKEIEEAERAQLKKHQEDHLKWLQDRNLEIIPIVEVVGTQVRKSGYGVFPKK